MDDIAVKAAGLKYAAAAATRVMELAVAAEKGLLDWRTGVNSPEVEDLCAGLSGANDLSGPVGTAESSVDDSLDAMLVIRERAFVIVGDTVNRLRAIRAGYPHLPEGERESETAWSVRKYAEAGEEFLDYAGSLQSKAAFWRAAND